MPTKSCVPASMWCQAPVKKPLGAECIDFEPSPGYCDNTAFSWIIPWTLMLYKSGLKGACMMKKKITYSELPSLFGYITAESQIHLGCKRPLRSIIEPNLWPNTTLPTKPWLQVLHPV